MGEYWSLTNHHKYLVITSHSCLVSAVYGYMYYTPTYPLYLFPALTYINSVNYWRHPRPGLRRNIDMIYICSAILIQHFIAHYYIHPSWAYYFFVIVGASMYPAGYWFYWRKQYIMSTFVHSLIHILGNFAHMQLYTGNGLK